MKCSWCKETIDSEPWVTLYPKVYRRDDGAAKTFDGLACLAHWTVTNDVEAMQDMHQLFETTREKS